MFSKVLSHWSHLNIPTQEANTLARYRCQTARTKIYDEKDYPCVYIQYVLLHISSLINVRTWAAGQSQHEAESISFISQASKAKK